MQSARIEVLSHDLAPGVDAEGYSTTGSGERGLQGREDPVGIDKAMLSGVCSTRINIKPHDLAAIVDAEGLSGVRARIRVGEGEFQGREDAGGIEKAMPSTLGEIEVLPHDLALIVDAEGGGGNGASERDIQGRKDPVGIDKAMPSVRIELAPHDLALIVNAENLGEQGAGEGDFQEREDTGGVEKAMQFDLIGVVPHNLASTVDADGSCTNRVGERDINRGVGIRGVLGRDKGTEQDTQGQHNRQQHAVHGKPSFDSWEIRSAHTGVAGRTYLSAWRKYSTIDACSRYNLSGLIAASFLLVLLELLGLKQVFCVNSAVVKVALDRDTSHDTRR
jgi:hypothetical protein